MAYLKEIPAQKCRRCGAAAKVELINSRNGPVGFFCRGCGKHELKAAEQREEEDRRGAVRQ